MKVSIQTNECFRNEITTYGMHDNELFAIRKKATYLQWAPLYTRVFVPYFDEYF